VRPIPIMQAVLGGVTYRGSMEGMVDHSRRDWRTPVSMGERVRPTLYGAGFQMPSATPAPVLRDRIEAGSCRNVPPKVR
jgi:hypothetical protein